jgi:hypothetical protein
MIVRLPRIVMLDCGVMGIRSAKTVRATAFQCVRMTVSFATVQSIAMRAGIPAMQHPNPARIVIRTAAPVMKKKMPV